MQRLDTANQSAVRSKVLQAIPGTVLVTIVRAKNIVSQKKVHYLPIRK